MDVYYIMNKKVLVGLAGALLSVSLVACGDKTVAVTNGGKITQSEYYSSMKNTSNGKQVLQQMILDKVLNKEYGNKVSSSEVNAQYNQYKSQYGSEFETLLEQQGLTTTSFKNQLKSNLLLKAAVRANISYSTADLKKQFKNYQPKVTVNEILVSDKKTAEKVISELKDGKKFSDLAKKYSKDTSNKNKSGRVTPFDNTDSSIDSAFRKAAYKLSNGEYTKTPVKTQYGYQIIQMVNHPKKGSYSDHINDLKDQIATSKLSDSTTLKNVVTKVLKNGGVEIKDKDLQNILSSYLTSSSSSK
ncbi:Foldase protein PrsA (Precursor) [Apilactobacillus kunkeei]|uniref:Foldase protein PrsA n=2 Tax=Apilactobacillus kunkeei TaxID=148814 RepID=A0AAC8WDT2_9LACO|nr:peptidylprolyl isomerase [Apilactobacillus kunkeei]KFJ15470.1 peptidylprolyl isomerase [Apilactobacillus kunkeei]KOY71145.1 Foldase protein PrsA (Precursor) [Apilactobacillus kunkeei]